ncbi:MAG: hypothetical protein OEM25_07225, partial [Gammaproteobacteria bacterium]|nr:hypothetical protein [Gammaproteobacteria bacterium]
TVNFSRSFYRTTAICSFLSVATTLALIFLPRFYGPADSFEQRMELVQHPVYILRAWTYLLHPFVVTAAALGVAVRLRRVAPGCMTVGFLGFLLWAFTEATQQALTLVAFRRWASAFLEANTAAQDVIRAQMSAYYAVWDAMFLLLLIGFFIGSTLYGIATVRRHGFDRVLGVLYLAVALLTLGSISREVGGPVVPTALSIWLYPTLQPLARLLIGVWLWKSDDILAATALAPSGHQ